MEPGKIILIIAKPGALRTGLQALLLSISPELQVLVADDGTQALEMVRKQPASLCLLEDDRTGGKTQDILQEIRHISPQSKCMLLLEEVQGQTRNSLADAAILKGTPPEHFVRIVESMLEGESR